MKRFFLLWMSFILTTVLWAYDFQSGDLYYNITSSTAPYTVEVTYQSSWYSDDYNYNYMGLTSVTIPATVTYDGTTYSVTSIGDWAFWYCTGLTSVTIGNSVTSIGSSAFSGCTSLTSIVVESGNTVYDSRENCNAIIETATNTLIQGCKTTVIPNSVTSIGGSAFAGCTDLTSVTIPNSVTSIGNYAFYNCTGLTSITIPESVTSIGDEAFYNVPNIVYNGTATGSPWGARSMNGYVDGYLVYADATKTTLLACSSAATGAVTIPNSVTSIGSRAFYSCTGLTSITIPNSVTSIGDYAFYYCNSLTSITIPESVTSIGDGAFYNVPNIVYNGTATGSPWGAKSVNGYVEDYLVYADATKTTLLACSSAATGAITIPNSVTSIGDDAFSGCTGLTSITIPNSVTSIGERAFYWCTSLTSITIPNSVKSIGGSAFSWCTGLTSITIPNSVTSIGNYAFQNCTGLTSITIPESVTSIGSSAFSGCTGLTSVVWNAKQCAAGWSSSSDSPFYSARNSITSFTFGNEVESIPAYLCYGMANLTSITIPESVTSIGNSAFGYCTGLTSVTIPNSVTSIGGYAFSGCSGLTSVTIPNSVTSIGDKAFQNCTGLTSVTIGNSVTSIENSTFYSCSGLTSITIPNSVTSIGNSAFSGCTGLTSIAIPNSVTSIGNSAFSSCKGLTSITIPESVTSIGDEAFYNVPNIVYNGTATGSPWGARSVNGYVEGYLVYADATKTTLLACSSAATGAVTIPNSVTSIGERAFYKCTGLTSITIPESVTSIGNYAFYDCTGLTAITIPNSVTSIGEDAFSYCTGLTSITIPNSVTSIGNSAFSNCTGLASIIVENGNTIYDSRGNCNAIIETATNTLIQGCKTTVIPNSVTSIGSSAFRYCTGLTSITIPNSVTSIGDRTFVNCTSLTSVTIPNSVTSIGERAFYRCTSLTSITIPNSVTSIGDRTFMDCTSLTSVTIGNSVTSIGDWAFYKCTGLSSITIPNSVTSIGDYAFYDCTGLTSVTIGNHVTSIGDKAFYNCTGLTSVTIPNSVTSIGDYAFSYCAGLTSVTIPESVTSIGYGAFSGCTGLTSVTIGNSVTSIGNYAFRNCTGLTAIQVEAQTPPQCGTNSFGNVPKDIPVYIPIGTKEAYQAAEGWSSFTNFIEKHNYAVAIQSSNEEYGMATIVSHTYDNELTIQAVANEHYHFTHWSDGNTDNPRTFLVIQDTTLTAFFAPNQYTISATATNGRVEGAGTYNYGTTITLTATANEHYHFTQWNDGNTDNPRSVSVEGNATYTAMFVIDQHVISATATNGRIEGTGEYDYGSTATLTAIANEHYHFTQWSDGNTDNPRTVSVVGDAIYIAEFSINQYTISVTCDIRQGIVTGGGVFEYGVQISLQAIPNSGYEFKQWSNGFTYNPYRFTVLEDLTLEAEFIPATAIDNISADTDTTPQKVLIDGQVYILRNGKMYTLTGVEVE